MKLILRVVSTFRKQQRAGEGARPVRVRGQGRSLLSRQGKRLKTRRLIRL